MNIRNGFVIDNPELMQEWDYAKNNEIGLKPERVTDGSNKVAYWICLQCGNHYQAMIKNRKRAKYGCPDCVRKFASAESRKTKIAGKSPLSETHPQLAKEWVECVDTLLTPDTVTSGSNKEVKWKCPTCGEIYPANIANRALRKSGCPYCAGIKVLKGVNDLQTVNPELANEWSDRNSISPSEVLPFSHQKVYWKCPAGHNDYPSTVQSRSSGQGCPICASESQTSFPEQAIFYFIKQVYADAINRYKVENKYEIDIYIPSISIGIEYNGYYAHKHREDKDKAKKDILEQKGIKVIFVKEYKVEKEKQNADYYIRTNYNFDDLTTLISRILLDFYGHIPIAVDVKSHSLAIREQYLTCRKENSIFVKMPSLRGEWDYERNGKINPEFVSYGSHSEYYWICPKCSSSYLASAKRRTSGEQCPYCAGKQVLSGVNDLATRYPELLEEWDYTKNKKLPNEVYGGGRKTAYFVCSQGHSYKRQITEKIKGMGCPICAGKKVLAGFNDLLSQKPDLVLDWDYAKNNIAPDKVHANSFKKYYWKCHVCGFEWKFAVMQRIHCPNCTFANKIINVYNFDGSLYGSFNGVVNLCKELGVNSKSHGNVSSVCMRKQKTLLSKYILRYDRDDEFKGHTRDEIKCMIAEFLGGVNYETRQNPFINVYDIMSFQYVATYKGFNELCTNLQLKNKSNISSVCQRRQKTILGRYILRYDYDDEFKGLDATELERKIQDYLRKKIKP